MSQTKSRITWIDMARGYGILFVIFGHCDVAPIDKWIYTFHIPLFFFLSGFVFSTGRNFSTFLKKRCRSILVPYVCLGIPMLLFSWFVACLKGYGTGKDLANLGRAFLVQRRMWTIWFLACLFLLNILFYGTVKVLKTNGKLIVFSVVSVLLGMAYYKYVGPDLPWNIDVCFMAYPFFLGGYLYRKKHDEMDKYLMDTKISAALFVAFAVLNILFWQASLRISGAGLEMFYSKYGCAPCTYLSAFAGIACVIIASKWATFKPIQYIGENSLLYFAWHQTILFPIAIKCLKLAHLPMEEPGSMGMMLLCAGLELLFVLAALTVCNQIILHTKLKFMLGK